MELGDVIYEKRTVISIKSTVSPRDYEDDVQYKVERVNAIEIPDNATNGDMIKALFPNTEIRKGDTNRNRNVSYILVDNLCVCHFREEWWNAPYKKGE